MGRKIEECVWEHSPYTLASRLVHAEVAYQAGDDHSYLWASQTTIARRAKLSRQTVNEIMSTLAQDGWIEPVEWGELPPEVQARVPDKRVRVYLVLLCEACGRHWGKPGRVGNPDTSTCRVEEPDVSALDPRCVGSSQLVLLPTEVKETGNSITPIEHDFERLWARYPRRVGRQRALRSYTATRRRDISAGVLLDAALAYAESMRRNKTETQFVLHGSTFFGPDEPWRDYVDGPIVHEARRSPLSRGGPSLAELQAAAMAEESEQRDRRLPHGVVELPKG